MNEIKVVHYDETPIRFAHFRDKLMINTSDFSHNDKPSDFLKKSKVQNFIDLLTQKDEPDCIYQEVQPCFAAENALPAGTWMNAHLATRYAKTLSPDLEVWLFHEILSEGRRMRNNLKSFAKMLQEI